MNKYNAKEYITLVQAVADGKTIQYNAGSKSNPDWNDLPEFTACADACNYRIKPDPREWKACVSTIHHAEPGLLFNYDKGDESDPKFEVIRVREILD